MSQYDDLEEIRELYNRYAIAFDENHPEEHANCFLPDGVFQSLRGRFAGREAIIRNMKEFNVNVIGNRKQRHINGNISIKLEGDRASGYCYLVYCIGDEGKLEHLSFGIYHDELRKVGGTWYFASRVASTEGAMGLDLITKR